MKQGYTTSEVAELLGLPVRQVRAFARAGVVEADRHGRAWVFGFRDLVLLRTAKSLRDAHVPHARILRSLDRLKRQLPTGRSLSELSVRADGEEVVVVDAGAAWNPESGQLQLEFDVSDLAARVEPLARRSARAARGDAVMDAEDWFELGLELEPVAVDEARHSYERALELAPRHADAHVNLGRLLHESGQPREAERHYRSAVELRPEHATAWFNLGVVLEDTSRAREAIRCYLEALRLDARLADAHYNLARLYERLGDQTAALRHLHSYRRLSDSA